MKSVILFLSLVITTVSFAENKATKADRNGGQTPGCPSTSEGKSGKDDNRSTGKRVNNPSCGTAGESKGNGGAKK